MRCLRFPTAFPIDDVGLHNVIKLLTGSETKPTKKKLKNMLPLGQIGNPMQRFIYGEPYIDISFSTIVKYQEDTDEKYN